MLSFVTKGLSSAMPDFMQTKKSTTHPVTTNKKSATGPFKKSAKQSTAARSGSPDESSVLDANMLHHKANSDWSDSLDPGISCGGKKGKGLMKAQRRMKDVNLVCLSIFSVMKLLYLK